MESIDIKKLKRNDKKIKSYLKMTDTFVTITEDSYILFPEKYEKKDLATLSNTCSILGIAALVVGNEYALLKIPTNIETSPEDIENVEIENEVYYKFHYSKNSVIIENTNIVKKMVKAYDFFDLFIMQGKIPWFVEYEDLISIFANLEKYTGLKAIKDTLVVETLAGIITKVKNKPEIDFRLAIKKPEDMKKYDPEYVGLMNVYYSYKSTTNKVLGNFFTKSINSSILYPEKNVSDLEDALRE